MSNTPNDFDFDDDIFGNGHNGDDEVPDAFDFGDGPELPVDDDLPDDLPTGVIPTAAGDMPVIEVEPEPGGGASRSFILIAVALIFIFAVGLIALLLLATRPTGPTDLELTSTQVVMLNATVEAQLAATQTQSSEFQALTLTAAAATATPEPTLTPTATEPAPTEALPPTTDPTNIAQTQQAQAFSETATALAQPTQAPTLPPTEGPTGLPTASPTSDFANLFATQVAFATQSSSVDNAILATLDALATAAAVNPQQPVIIISGPDAQATAAALGGSGQIAATAGAIIDSALNAFAQTAAPLQTQIAALTPAAQATSAVLSTQVAGLQATQSAVQQQVGSLIATVYAVATPGQAAALDALATQIASLQGQDPVSAQATQVANLIATQAAGAGQVAGLQSQIDALQQLLNDLNTQLNQATSQPINDDQATLVAGFEATQTASQAQIAALQAQIVALQAQLDALNGALAQATSQPPVDAQSTLVADLQATQGALSLEVFNLQATLVASGPSIESTLFAAGTQIAAANQQLLMVQGMQATQGAQATAAALATRESLVQQLISGTVVAIVPTSPLDAVNQTATALVQFYQTPQPPAATLEGATPAFPTAEPTALPHTGLFDEVGGGDTFPILAIAVVGLVGVIVIARVLRRKNGSGDDRSGDGSDEE
ncbi:MAG TPA: hypothetical protein VER79_06700 [Candidatus Limnocylindrales bacterium]|nr:hypothetical protein [Candidatus Limnocylindrales bacterium]